MIIDTTTYLHAKLNRYYPDWEINDLGVAGSGLESLIYRANTVNLGTVAIRVPRTRWLSSDSWVSADNKSSLDSRNFLRQEAVLSSYLRAYDVPTPIIHALHFGDDDFDFMISSFIDQDRSLPYAEEFGRLIKTLHMSPPPSISFALSGDAPINDLLVKRLIQRLQFIERATGICLKFPPADEIHTMLEWSGMQSRLLHMDARPENILTRDGHILAIIDWSSALLGDPALELARIAEYGFLCSSFLQGYNDRDCLARLPRRIELLYRLDTAAMLAVVFMAEAPDQRRARDQVQRALKLCTTLNRDQRCD